MAIPLIQASIGTIPYTVRLGNPAGHHWLADEPPGNGGANAGPAPTELLLSSLGACTAITLQMYAGRKQWPLTGIHIELALNPADKPGSGIDISRSIDLQGDLSDEQQQRLLQVAAACPVHKLLTGEVRIISRLGAVAAFPDN